MRTQSERLDFRFCAHDENHAVGMLLVVFEGLDHPGGVCDLHHGFVSSGTPVTVFDFDEDHGDVLPEERVGFVLHYPTDWPTFELGTPGNQDRRLSTKRRVTADPDGGGRPADRRPSEHEFSRALLASELCEYLAAQRDWVFGFSGPYAFGSTHRTDEGDLRRVLQVAQGVADRLPHDVVASWSIDPAIIRRPRRRAS